MRAWRLPAVAADPLGAEGASAAALWEAGASAVLIDGRDLVGFFAEAPAEAALPAGGRWEPVDDADYLGAYLEGLEPVDAGAVVVAPTHREPRLRACQQVVWLDPGMAFGSGHHETTRLALEALGRLDLVGRRLLDVGAGSGVLAIAGDKLGAAEARGLDLDPATLPVAWANAARNRSRASFAAGGFGEVPLALPLDVLVANLDAESHLRLLHAYRDALAPGGDLLLSGILDPRDRPLRAAVPPGLTLVDARRDGAWWLLHLRRVG